MIFLTIYGFCVLICFGLQNIQAQNTKKETKYKYDIAAFYWPAYHPDSRFNDINVFPDGKGEWEAIYKAKPKFTGHEVPKVPLWDMKTKPAQLLWKKK